MNLISIEEKLPNNDKYRLVMLDDGLHICRYSEIQNTWLDRENWHYNDVTHWQPLPKENT